MTSDIRKLVMESRDFVLPDAYIELYGQGRLKHGESREDWQANWREIMTTNPPALSCTPWHLTVEWASIESLIEWRAPDSWSLPRFIRFAGDGYGNHWGWDPDRVSAQRTPVLFCCHDEHKAEVFGATFGDFLYRMHLEAFANIAYDDMDELELDENDYKEHLDLHVSLVAPFISPDALSTLEAILDKPMTDQPAEERCFLLSDSERQRIIERDLTVSGVGTSFSYLK